MEEKREQDSNSRNLGFLVERYKIDENNFKEGEYSRVYMSKLRKVSAVEVLKISEGKMPEEVRDRILLQWQIQESRVVTSSSEELYAKLHESTIVNQSGSDEISAVDEILRRNEEFEVIQPVTILENN